MRDKVNKWIEQFANHTTEDPMGDFFKFRDGARAILEETNKCPHVPSAWTKRPVCKCGKVID